MKLVLTICAACFLVLAVSCDADKSETVNAQVFPAFPNESSLLLAQFKEYSQKGDGASIYSLFSDSLRFRLPKSAFVKSLDQDWSIQRIDLINIEDYGRYKAFIVQVVEKDRSNIESRMVKILYVVEEGGSLKLYNFPFTKSGGAGLVLRTPECFQL